VIVEDGGIEAHPVRATRRGMGVRRAEGGLCNERIEAELGRVADQGGERLPTAPPLEIVAGPDAFDLVEIRDGFLQDRAEGRHRDASRMAARSGACSS
jgi:hypothetical protein